MMLWQSSIRPELPLRALAGVVCRMLGQDKLLRQVSDLHTFWYPQALKKGVTRIRPLL